MMKARLENDIINLYNERNIWIGGIKVAPDFKNAEFKIGEKTFQLSHSNEETKVLENGNSIYSLKTDSFSGNIKIQETKNKITGVWGLKWATKMIDEEHNTLLKIRNENQFINTNKYEIEISDHRVPHLEILISLYGHIYGSNLKTQAVILGTIAVTLACIGLT